MSESPPTVLARVAGLWTPRRAAFWLAIAAFFAWLPLLVMPASQWADFGSFWTAGKLAFTPQVVGLQPVLAYESAHRLPPTPFLYPPWFALVYVPFTWLPFDVAGALHVLLQLAALIGAALLGGRLYGLPRRWAVLGALAWSPAAAGVLSGQNSALLLLLVVIAAGGVTSGRWAVAGIALGLGLYRPQLGLPVVALAAWRGVWRAVAVALVVLLVEYLLGVVASGGMLDWPLKWLAAIGSETGTDFAAVGWQAISLPGLLGRISFDGSAQGALLGPALVGYLLGGIVIVVALPALRAWDAPRAVALACALALLVDPRGWSYDGTLLLPVLAILARDAKAKGWRDADRWLLAAAFAIALTWRLGIYVGVNPEALLVLAAPVILLDWARLAGPRGGPRQPQTSG